MYTDFGQNRVQYKNFEWQYYRTENFDAYFYAGGKELAAFAMRTAEKNVKSIEKVMDYRMSGRVEFIVYNTHSDYKQSNIGMTDQQVNTGGYTRVYDNKVFLYFDGDHDHFTQQVKAGLAEVMINEMLYGGSFTERLQNAALLSLPEWYESGLITYISEGWTAIDDSRMKDALKSKRFKRFNALSNDDAIFAGKSIWKFLIETSDERVVSNLLYITRVTRNIESSFFYVLGMKMREMSDGWESYYTKLYEKDDNGRTLPKDETEIKLPRYLRKSLQPNYSISPMGNNMLLVTNTWGKYKVYQYDLLHGGKEMLYKGGFRYKNAKPDKTFPLVAWHPNGKSAGIFIERKGYVRFISVNLETHKRETIKLLKLEKVTGFQYNPSGNLLLITGTRKGQSDIFILELKSQRERQITNDFYDDKDACFIDDGKRIMFASNRSSDSLNAPTEQVLKGDNNYDIFIYDLEAESELLHRVTETPYVNETQPQIYNQEFYTYLTDYNGVQNRYVAKVDPIYDYVELRILSKDTSLRQNDTLLMDTLVQMQGNVFTSRGRTYYFDSLTEKVDTIMHYRDLITTYPVTDFTRSILAHEINTTAGFSVDLIYNNNTLRLYKLPLFKDIPEESKSVTTYYTAGRSKKAHLLKPFKRGSAFLRPSLWQRDSVAAAPREGVGHLDNIVERKDSVLLLPPDTGKYYFLNEFTNRENFKIDQVLHEQQPQARSISKEKLMKLTPPRSYDMVFLPDYFITQLDNTVINTYYQPYVPGSQHFFNPGFNGMFKLGISDLFNDKRIMGGFRLAVDLRGSDVFLAYENNRKRLDKRIQYFRQSRFVAGDNYQRTTVNELRVTYRYPFSERSALRLNVFGRQDRTYILSSDAYNATRESVARNWAGSKLEYIYDNTVNKGLNLYNGLRFKFFVEAYKDVDTKKNTLAAAGIDVRHYQKIHRQIILATRVAGNTSLGNARIVYFLGGVDNWISPRYNADILVAQNKNYVYQALATNMRGFIQNIRNGTSFVVMNNELRIPLFSYLSNHPVKSDFLKNFLLVPFADVGTAWSGPNPYSDDNTFNKRIINHYPLTISVVNIREPFVGGVGGGAHMKLFGYYVRGDVAWGIEDLQVHKDPVYYVSISTDF